MLSPAGRRAADPVRCDVVVVGSGVAGLCAALEAASSRSPVAGAEVVLVTGGAVVSGCTEWAQGGIAAALGDGDDPALHAADTIAAGRGLCDPRAVGVLVEEGPAQVRRLVDAGVALDRAADGRLALGREAAHSRARIVHANGDATGRAIAVGLGRRLAPGGVRVLEGHVAVALLDDADGRCLGVAAVAVASGESVEILAPATVLATGGAGALYGRTTNPDAAVGAGVALGYDAGAEIASMELVQFHPTALAAAGAPAFLLSEALRGEGAHVVDGAGERFLFAADPRGELAPRDTVAAAIAARLAATGAASAFLDARHIPGVAARFPTVAATLGRHGIDLAGDLVPIAPAAHYTIGGVRTDLDGATAVAGLYAAGEVASTGVHGANRLASNSLLEGMVFGTRAGRAARDAAAESPRTQRSPLPPPANPAVDPAAATAERAALARLRAAMDAGAGITRDAAGLQSAVVEVCEVAAIAAGLPLPPTSTLRGAARTASLVCQAAALRTESRGCHRRSDHPEPDAGQATVWVLHHDRSPHRDDNP